MCIQELQNIFLFFVPAIFLCPIISATDLFMGEPYNSKPGNPHFIVISMFFHSCASNLLCTQWLVNLKKILIYRYIWQRDSKTNTKPSLVVPPCRIKTQNSPLKPNLEHLLSPTYNIPLVLAFFWFHKWWPLP